jgi:hypothetical protein
MLLVFRILGTAVHKWVAVGKTGTHLEALGEPASARSCNPHGRGARSPART